MLFRDNKKGKKDDVIAYVEVQPRYKVSFEKRDPKTDKFKTLNSVEFDKKSNVTKLLRSKGFRTPTHQQSFDWASDQAYEKKIISIGINGTKRK